MSCRAVPCLLTHFVKVCWHSTAPHHFFSSVNESTLKWAVLALKNLLLEYSSLASFIVFCPEDNDSLLKWCGHIQGSGNLERRRNPRSSTLYKDACCTPNKQVYGKIWLGMAEAGYERTGVQCRDKLKSLNSEYEKVKDNKSKTGRRRKAWKFCSCMN